MRFFETLQNLMNAVPTHERRLIISEDAREYTYDYMFLVPTGIAGLTGIMPNNNYFYALPPTDFEFAVTPAKDPNNAPVGTPNPLITPALALSFIQNNLGR